MVLRPYGMVRTWILLNRPPELVSLTRSHERYGYRGYGLAVLSRPTLSILNHGREAPPSQRHPMIDFCINSIIRGG